MNRYLVVTSSLTDPKWVVVSPVYAVDGAQCIINDMGLTPGELIRVGGSEVNYIETIECTDPDSLDNFACSARKGQIAIRCSADIQIGDLERYLDVERYPLSKQNPGDPYHLCVQTGTLGNDAVLLIANPTLELQDPGDRLVGTWELDGTPAGPIDQDLYQQIRPFGNSQDGAATGALDYHGVAGDKQRMVGDPESSDLMTQLYPDPPFEIMVHHYWYEQAEFSGYGFLAEITGGAESRDPSARAMAVYSDPECTAYLWTGGAYQLGPSRLGQVDDSGEPLQVWFSDTPPGQRTQEPQEWHLACLFGSAQEGHATLPIGGELLLQFWDRIQGGGGGGSEWVDTGATVTAQAGTVYRISDADVAAALSPGQTIRFADGPETIFTGTWAGGADYLEIDPFVQAAVGDALWVFE